MSLVEEFVEQQLSKSLSSTITQHLQICHSAVEDLLVNLESLRSGPKLDLVHFKISRISVFLEAKQEILRLIQSEEDQPLIQWLIQEKLDSQLLVLLVRRQQKFVEDMLRKTIKGIFLSGERLQEYLQENQLVSNCLSLLIAIKEDVSSGRTPSREKLISVDNVEGVIWQKIFLFENKVLNFNRQIAKIIEQLYEFQNSLSEQFRCFFNKPSQIKNSPTKSRLDAFERQDLAYEENVLPQPSKAYDNEYSRTIGGGSKFGVQYRQDPLYRTSFPNKESYSSKIKPQNDISQLGIQSQIVINPSASRNKERILKSQLVEARSFLR